MTIQKKEAAAVVMDAVHNLSGKESWPVYDGHVLSQFSYMFFTGKGGVGKTSVACATAVYLAEQGKKVLLVSTDPASNLQDVFGIPLSARETEIQEVPGLMAANLDPVEAAREYRESVVAPYRGVLPEAVIASMEEQLSGACTVEIAAFNEFARLLTDPIVGKGYDHILFDTAPTGHTLRMLQLPSAWSGFIQSNTHGASCLGQLSGLEKFRTMYEDAVCTLQNEGQTVVVLVSRPEKTPLEEANRASRELRELGVCNQTLLVNGVMAAVDYTDPIARRFSEKQIQALQDMPVELRGMPCYQIPLRPYMIHGIQHIRQMLSENRSMESVMENAVESFSALSALVEELHDGNRKVVFTMGKGGVGKSTVAAAIAMGLAAKGRKVHLTTTDPAHHLHFLATDQDNIRISHIDEEKELATYRQEVLSKAQEGVTAADLDYIEEDLRSPCTQEVAVFRAFARLVDSAGEEVVVVDTAPTGHTLLLLDATQSYHREIEKSQGDIPEHILSLLPRLRNQSETEVVIVTLPEATPVYEAERLEADLRRAGIYARWWVINSSLYCTKTQDQILRQRAELEGAWLNRVIQYSKGKTAVIPWISDDLTGKNLLQLL